MGTDANLHLVDEPETRIAINYADAWRFWLDDACYRVARGARYLDIPSEVSRRRWDDEIHPAVASMEEFHGVVIRYEGDDDGGEVQVCAAQWVADLLARAAQIGGFTEDAIRGVLLGYSAQAIAEYLGDDEDAAPAAGGE